VTTPPAESPFGSAVARFDEWFDQALDHVRGNAVADRVF